MSKPFSPLSLHLLLQPPSQPSWHPALQLWLALRHCADAPLRRLFPALACALALTAGAAQAQAPAAVAPGLAQPPGAPGKPGVLGTFGQGAGVHGADSPFPPLAARSDVVPWSVLAPVKTRTEKQKIVPLFTKPQLALDQRTQRIQGFMLPLQPGPTQKHFLLSSVPLTCGFCMPGGPESIVEVKTRVAVSYSMAPLVVEGRFEVLQDDDFGMYYRLSDAASVK